MPGKKQPPCIPAPVYCVEVPSCCESINAQRTALIAAVASTINTVSSGSFDEYTTFLDNVDGIKTCAFNAFEALQESESNPECCAAAAEAITAAATQALNLILIALQTGLVDAQTELKAYARFINLIVSSFKNCGSCCVGISNGITVFSTSEVTSSEFLLGSGNFDLVRDDLQKALCCLLRNAPTKCCEAAGAALGAVAVGVLDIINRLNAARSFGYFPTDEARDAQIAAEIEIYHNVLNQILCAAGSKCGQCCSDVVAGIALLYLNPSDGNASIPFNYFILATFPVIVGSPQQAVVQDFYLAYLDLLRQIRKVALCQYERILEKAENKKCCEAVTEGLAFSTINFTNALRFVFLDLINYLLSDPPVTTLDAAILALQSFADEYPPLAQQIANGVIGECGPCKKSKSKSSDKKKSSESKEKSKDSKKSEKKSESKEKSSEKKPEEPKKKSESKEKSKCEEPKAPESKHEEKSEGKKPRYY